MQTDFIPQGFQPADDMPHRRPDDALNWTESYAVWAYMQDSYLYMHFQRHLDDTQLWGGYAMLLGEDGSILSTYQFGRQCSDLGPGYQQVRCEVEKPFEVFRVKVDSLAQPSSWATLRESQLPSLNGDAIPLQIDLRYDSISPTYQPMPQDDDNVHSNAKWTHFTPCRVEGSIIVGNQRKAVSCLGWRDHSAGARSFESMGEGVLLTGIFPSGKSYMALAVDTHKSDGVRSYFSAGGVTVDGKISYLSDMKLPDRIISLAEPDAELGTLILESEHGTSEITMRTLNQGVPLGMIPPCHETIGLPQGLSTPKFYHDWRVELEWDGEKGVGCWDPSLCRS